MIFTEFRFLGFFLVAFLVHWGLRGLTARKIWLLICSYVFYAAWDWRFLFLILASTLVDFVAGMRIHDAAEASRKRRWLQVSLVANLGLLGVFKYLGFFIDSGVDLLHFMGFEASRPVLGIVLPVGISFYTFQTMSYSLDVYFGRLKPTRSLLDLALFVGFFPQLVAGPIVRASLFLPLLKENRRFSTIPVRYCLVLFFVGFVKKACISDNVVAVVDPFFRDPGHFSALGAWTGVLMYAVQIYCDFSGYSDMAIACAGLLGYTLPLNFNFPYLAADIREFWRRWHISLSTWLRDYLYIPLGGSRGSKWFTYRNLMLTMLLGGLWHGAGWNFVIWGGLHGLALVVHREWERSRLPALVPAPVRFVVGTVGTFWWVCLAWIFFRSATFSEALGICRSFALFDSPGARSFGMGPMYVFAGLVAAHVLGATHMAGRSMEKLPGWAFAAVYGALWPIALAFMNGAVQPFIYFQF